MATKKNSGSVCAARNCKSRSYVSPELSFFTFPKDTARARIWLIACQREDLLEKANTLHRNYKLCELHFEVKMIVQNYLRKRLLANAVPTRFPQLEESFGASVFDHTYTPFAVQPLGEPATKNQIVQNIALTPGATETFAANATTSKLESARFVPLKIEIVEMSVPELVSPNSCMQTPLSPSATSSRKKTFRDRVRQLEQENKSLKRKIELLEAEAGNNNFITLNT